MHAARLLAALVVALGASSFASARIIPPRR
jgi:hypothetical protein